MAFWQVSQARRKQEQERVLNWYSRIRNTYGWNGGETRQGAECEAGDDMYVTDRMLESSGLLCPNIGLTLAGSKSTAQNENLHTWPSAM